MQTDTMRRLRHLTVLAALPAVLVLAACDRSSTDADHAELASLEVIDRTQTAQPVVATWTDAGGWEGAIPVLDIGERERITLGVRIFDSDGDELTLSESGPFSVRYSLAAGAPQGVIDMSDESRIFHGDHVEVYGTGAGTTQIQFLLWDVDHADGATDPIPFTVVE